MIGFVDGFARCEVRSFVVAPRLAAPGAAMQSKCRERRSMGSLVSNRFATKSRRGRRFVVMEQQKKSGGRARAEGDLMD